MDKVLKDTLMAAGFKKIFGLAEMGNGNVIFVDLGCDWLSRAGMMQVLKTRVEIELVEALKISQVKQEAK
jgi:hypothetical protein